MRRRPFLNVLIAAGAAAACSDAPGPGEIATHLAFQTQPAASFPLLPIVGPVRVAVLDEQNRVVTGASHMITVGVGANPSGAALVGVETAPAVGGVATFSNIALTAPGSGFTLVASASGLTGATSTLFNVATPIAARIAFQTQPAGSVKDSILGPGPIRVALLDENGDVLPPAFGVVQISIGANPGGATLSGTSSVATEDGVATFSGLRLDAVGAGYTLVAQFGGVAPVTTNAFDVTLSLADVDGDGYSPNAGDCDDTNPGANPGVDDDRPDALFIDANCDGIDGEKDNAVFASPFGSDNAACGTQAAPCRNVSFAIQRATAQAKRDVYLFEGSYIGPVTLANGVSIYGGYYNFCPNDVCVQFWRRQSGGVTGISGELITNVDIGVGEPQTVTMFGANLSTPATIADVLIYAPLRLLTNLTTAAGRGRSSYAIILRDVAPGALTIERVGIFASNGYTGSGGANGGSAPVTPAMEGGAGGNGAEPAQGCDDTSRGTAGAAGTSAVVGSNGGAGGRGGARNTDCNPATLNLSAQAGEAGQNAEAFQLGVFGTGGAFGPGSGEPCAVGPSDGLPGRVVNGDRGAAIGARGFLENDFWAGFSGHVGGLGLDGTGGGGGGGAGGCGETYGAGGGGGGAGGARAHTAAGGGRAGGGSFGVYLINASPTLRNSHIFRGTGGGAGGGGIGGQGQSGGVGGAGGTGAGALVGGRGGSGAHGGHGSGGGGGAGGISVGIFRTSAASVPMLTNVVFQGSTGVQSGGPGGASAPTAPLAERDGIAGRDGPFGGVFDVFLCAGPTGC